MWILTLSDGNLFFPLETPKKSVSVPEELVARGHSRTNSYASQLSKISGTRHRLKCKYIKTWIVKIINIYIFCRLQLKSLKFNRSEPSEECFRRLCLHRNWKHPGTRWSADRERREGEQDHSPSLCKLSPCSWTPSHSSQGSTVIHTVTGVQASKL